MTNEEQAVKILNGLYKMRDDARSLWGDGWLSKIQPAMDVLRRHMAAVGERNVFCAAAMLMKGAEQDGEPVAVMMFGAAAIELIEE